MKGYNEFDDADTDSEIELTRHDKIGLMLGSVIMVLMLALSVAWGSFDITRLP
jgi:hypothetical protein